jgi:hypothetical protein
MSHTTEQDVFEPQARPESRRIAFCPTCGRPFTHGSGVFQSACIESLPARGRPGNDPACKEYCSENCLPGQPA